ncbi:MAG TPA: carbon monoxide dehydrogenase subunit G [Acetobacteraceae bacterium]|nr:carbon monoxide dehydrogenase subunit G [Acetobacteraceae bacterium]
MTGNQRIAASPRLVWDALNDPDVLRRCIPGCQSLDKESDDRLRATVEIKIGPIGARFNGAVTLSDLDPPNGYTITGEGQGGTVGFAKGGAKVRLSEDGGGTLLSYDVDAQVGGRLAQLGGPIIDATAKQLAGKFFKQLGEIVGAPAAVMPVQSTAAVASVQSIGQAPVPASRLPAAWILALVVAVLLGFLVGRGQGAAGGSDWLGLSIGLLVVTVAAAGFEFGRRTAAPVVMLDPALLARLVESAKR